MCAQALVDSQNLRTGDDAAGGLGPARGRCDRLSRAPIYIDDTAGMNVMEIRSKARRLKSQEKGLSLIIVDYLQLMQGGDGIREPGAGDLAHLALAEAARARPRRAGDGAVAAVARRRESRTDKRPILSDLRESG